MSALTEARPAVRARKPRPKPSRFVNLIMAPTPTMPGICRITVTRGRKVQAVDYHLSLVPSAFGRGFLLVKILGEHTGYHVNLHGERSTCECKGFLAHGRPCKHIGACQKLVDLGRL